MIEFIDKTAVNDGTPISRANLMAMQGFQAQTTVFNQDGSITETNSQGHTKVTTFPSVNVIVETFTGTKTIVHTITFNQDGSITETLSEVSE